ncbi:MAG: hypothetical protein HPY44_08080 [Armatimonadetes bacterium]|nr:hypothetical protein [Armatimonadota bacterium]
MALPIPTNPMQMMPAYVEAIRSHVERELAKRFGQGNVLHGVHVSADQRDSYVLVTVYGVPSVLSVGGDAPDPDLLEKRTAELRALLQKILDSGAAYELTERLREEGHRVLIHIDAEV